MTSLVVQWLRLQLLLQGVWIQFPVKELSTHMPHGQRTQEHKNNIVTSSIKTLKTVHINNIFFFKSLIQDILLFHSFLCSSQLASCWGCWSNMLLCSCICTGRAVCYCLSQLYLPCCSVSDSRQLVDASTPMTGGGELSADANKPLRPFSMCKSKQDGHACKSLGPDVFAQAIREPLSSLQSVLCSGQQGS